MVLKIVAGPVACKNNRYSGTKTCWNKIVEDIAASAEGLRFDSYAGQIGLNVADGSPLLRCFFGAVLPRY